MADIVNLHHTEAGQGTPVVLLHGFPLNSTIWRDQQKALSDHFRVITPDLRGHGKSPAPPGVYTMDLLAGDVIGLLDSLNIRKAVIMGHSMGGYVTLALWRAAPERFLALGLIASQAGADTDEGRKGRYKTAEKVAAEGSNVMAEAMVPKLFAPGLQGDAPMIDQVRQMILATSADAIVGALKGMAERPDSTPMLPQIDVPTLVLAGANDQVIPAEKSKSTATSVKSATLKMIDHAGHMPMLEQPQATTAALREFLSGLRQI